MKKIAIIGGGIIGMTLANYLDPQNLTLPFMMKGSAKRLKRALGLFPLAIMVPMRELVKDFQLTEDIYRQSGTVILRPAAALAT